MCSIYTHCLLHPPSLCTTRVPLTCFDNSRRTHAAHSFLLLYISPRAPVPATSCLTERLAQWRWRVVITARYSSLSTTAHSTLKRLARGEHVVGSAGPCRRSIWSTFGSSRSVQVAADVTAVESSRVESRLSVADCFDWLQHCAAGGTSARRVLCTVLWEAAGEDTTNSRCRKRGSEAVSEAVRQ